MATRDFEYVAASFLSRMFVALLLLIMGVGKFVGGYMNFVDFLTGKFAESWIPQLLVSPLAYALPFIEVILGVLLLLGLWSQIMLLVSGALFLVFVLGTAALGDVAGVAQLGVFLLINTFALYLHGYDDWRLGH